MPFRWSAVLLRMTFFPFTLTRSVADIRCGILTIREKWDWYLKNNPAIAGWTYLCLPIFIPDTDLVRSLLSANPDLSLRNCS